MILRKSPTADHVGLKLLLEGEENLALNSPSVIFGEKRQDHRSFDHFFPPSFWGSGPQDRRVGKFGSRS